MVIRSRPRPAVDAFSCLEIARPLLDEDAYVVCCDFQLFFASGL